MSYRETRRRMDRRIALLMACTAPLALAMPAAASAQNETAAAQSFSIPAGSLSQALQAYSAQTGIQLVYSSDLVSGMESPGVRGRMTPAAALGQLLAGTGLGGNLSGNTATISGGAGGELLTGAVRVEGAQGSPYFGGAGVAAGVNGVNGSRDITATEGTGSFTSGALTIGSKVPQALKDVPQSISVLTSERIAQQNVIDFTTALKQLPGIALVQGSTSLENTFYSRGFAIGSIQVDGGAPFIGTSQSDGTGFGVFKQIDMSIYDHVELLRGAAGQFGSYGDPGGTVNLVRKKPLDHAQYNLEVQAGSWSNYRVVADASSPLALDGRLRGRLVMTYQDNDYFYDTAKDNKSLIYGIAEFDATPTTQITAGIDYTRQDSVPWFGGLPRYWNGDDLGLPRSASIIFSWNRWNFDTTEIFGGLEQQIGKDWVFKINLTHNRQSSAQKVGYSYGPVSPFTMTGPYMAGLYNDYASKQFSAEATLSGAFELFGQRQEVTFGVNRLTADGSGRTEYNSLVETTRSNPYQPYPGGPVYCTSSSGCPVGSIASQPPVDVFYFDPADPNNAEPRNPLPYFRASKNLFTQLGAYVNLRLTAFDRLHLTTGLRWSREATDAVQDFLCTTMTGICVGKQIGDVITGYGYISDYHADDISWPPPVSLSFDVTKSLTAYAGYSDIYQSQSYYLGHDRNPLPPITGSNWEAGLKWAASDGKLNLSLALYHVRKKGFGRIDPPDYSEYEDVGNGVACCAIADPDAFQESKGIDFEVAGELALGWQLAASYTYSENRQENGGIFYGENRIPFVSIQPKQLYKLWMSYDFGAAGHEGALSGLALSGGMNGQSSAYYSGTICTADYYTPYPTSPTYRVCTMPEEPYAFTVPGYAVFSARIDYRLSDTWSLAVNLENIFDKNYYQTVGSSPASGNWYGTPRSATATLRAKW